MKKIDQLLLKSFIGPFIVTFFIALFVLVMQFLWKYIDDLVGKGLEVAIIGELIFYASAGLVPMALPLAILLSSIMTFGNLGEHYELVSLKSSGISLIRIMASLVVAVIFLAGVAFWFSNYILPKANLRYGVLLYDITHKRPAFDISEGVFYNGIDGFSLKVGSKSEDGKTLNDVIIYDHSKGKGNNNVTIAEKAVMHLNPNGNYLTFQLFNGEQYEEQQAKPKPRKDDSFEHLRTKFKVYNKVFDMSGFEMKNTNEDLFKKNYQMLNVRQLKYSIDSIDSQIEKRSTILQKHLRKFVELELDTQKLLPKNKDILLDGIALKDDSTILYEIADSNTITLAKDTNKNLKEKVDTFISIDSIPTTSNIDSIPIFEVHPDSSILSTIPIHRRSSILKRALDNAKNSKGYVNVARRDVEIKGRAKNKYNMEWHRKFVLSFACIVLFFIGAPLGAITRKGGLGLPMILSIIFFVIYHLLGTFGKKLSEEFVLTPFQGMWMATLILSPLGIFLTYKALNDSNIINIDAYIDFFRKILQKFGLLKPL